MPDNSYQPKVYRKPGGDTQVIASGGAIDVESGGKILDDGVQAGAITNASVAHALNATFSDTEVEAALDALGGKINSILAAIRGAGIIVP